MEPVSLFASFNIHLPSCFSSDSSTATGRNFRFLMSQYSISMSKFVISRGKGLNSLTPIIQQIVFEELHGFLLIYLFSLPNLRSL